MKKNSALAMTINMIKVIDQRQAGFRTQRAIEWEWVCVVENSKTVQTGEERC